MDKVIHLTSMSGMKRLNHVRGLSGEEAEYVKKLIGVFREGSEQKKNALKGTLDVLYEHRVYTPEQ